ncbi:cell surface protein [Pediococcus stilesii]|uniref:Cell surface protein n=2 Tax=Pediococcus stilesii TaxID=331679 RepID=A0A5R9BWF4_9LACO|nr:cell surface protein [Pediococcus stilesii]TLQ04222.1 cell surface protein [Pediococcus stilesii]
MSKGRNKTIGIAFAATLAMSILPLSVFADDTPAGTGQGTTTVTFNAPKGDQLILNAVPSFDFGNKDLSASNEPLSADGSSSYDVTNLTGNSNGYTITASASTMTTKDAPDLPIKSLTTTTLDGTPDELTGGQITGSTDLNIYKKSNVVATGNNNANGRLTSGKTSASLTLGPAGVKSATYNGTIDYTIAANIQP